MLGESANLYTWLNEDINFQSIWIGIIFPLS